VQPDASNIVATKKTDSLLPGTDFILHPWLVKLIAQHVHDDADTDQPRFRILMKPVKFDAATSRIVQKKAAQNLGGI